MDNSSVETRKNSRPPCVIRRGVHSFLVAKVAGLIIGIRSVTSNAPLLFGGIEKNDSSEEQKQPWLVEYYFDGMNALVNAFT